MNRALDDIFYFLKSNREFNFQLQAEIFRSSLCVNNSKNPKVINLLYHVANTQSQPKLDLLADFYRLIYENIDSVGSFESFVKLLTGRSSFLYMDLYTGLVNQKGWGKKTAALFTKTVFQAHTTHSKEFAFWSDAPKEINSDDEILLPVDAVIIYIFKQLGMKNPNFSKVNKLLKLNYSGEDFEVWDDLWFWGFISQKVVNKNRVLEWNENKYWSLRSSLKDPIVISAVRTKTDQFIALLNMES